MRPATDLDGALPVKVVVDIVGVGDDVASIIRQERVDGCAVVAARVPVEHVPLGRDQHPEMAVLALVLGEHQDAGRIHAHVRLHQRVGEHRLDDRRCERSQLLVPRADRRPGQLEPLAPVDPFEPIERLVVLPAPDDRLGEQARPGRATFDGQFQRGHHDNPGRLAILGLLPHEFQILDPDHDGGRRASLQYLPHVAADLLEGLGLALHLGRGQHDVDAR